MVLIVGGLSLCVLLLVTCARGTRLGGACVEVVSAPLLGVLESDSATETVRCVPKVLDQQHNQCNALHCI